MGVTGTLAEAIVKLVVDGAGLAAGLGRAEADAEKTRAKMQATFDGIARAATVAFVAVSGAMVMMVHDFAESEQSAIRLQAALDRVGQGGSFENVSSQLDKMSEDLARDDELLSDMFSKLVDRTGNAADAMTALGVAQDLAAAKGVSLEQATNAISRAYIGNTRALMMMGVAVTEGAKGMEVINEVGTRYAGTAEKWAASNAAAWERLKTAAGNVREEIGGFLAPTLTALAKSAADAFKAINQLDAGTKQNIANALIWTAGLTGLIAVTSTAAGAFLRLAEVASLLKATQLGATFSAWGSSLVAFAKGPVGIAIAALLTLIAVAKQAEAVTRASEKKSLDPTSSPIHTGEGVMTSGDMSADTAFKGSDQKHGYNPISAVGTYFTELGFRRKIEETSGYLKDMQDFNRSQRLFRKHGSNSWVDADTGQRMSYHDFWGASHNGTVREGVANATGIN